MRLHKDERTALFIDGSNLYATAKALGFDIDYKSLLNHFENNTRMMRAIYYTALMDDAEYLSSPGLTKTSAAKSRSIGKRSAAVRPGDPVLPALVARCVSFGQSPALRRVAQCRNSKAHQDCALLMLHYLKRKAPLDPGSRDGLTSTRSGMTVGEQMGKPCRETSTLRGRERATARRALPAHAQRPRASEARVS
jgi:hypothetical protein